MVRKRPASADDGGGVKRRAAPRSEVGLPTRQGSGDSLASCQKNILACVMQQQLDTLPQSEADSLKKSIKADSSKGIQLSSLCSGSNVAQFALRTLMLLTVGKAGACKNVFDVEGDQDKQKWLKNVMHRNFDSCCIFREMNGMADEKAWCDLHNNKRTIPTWQAGPLLSSCGFSCKYVSRANCKAGFFKHGVKDKQGQTADTLHACHACCESHQPPFMALENVVQFLSTASSNLNELVKMFASIGYALWYVIVEASSWLPHRRKRVYFLCINKRLFGLTEEAARELLGKMVATVTLLMDCTKRSLAQILKPPGYASLQSELKQPEAVAARRTEQDSNCSWPEQHLSEMAKHGVTHSMLTNRAWKDNEWFTTLTLREQLVALYAHSLNPDAKTIDVSQGIDRVPSSSLSDEGSTDLCSTLLCASAVWLPEQARMLSGWEACLLQGIPVDALPGAERMGRRTLQQLSGDAFCGAAVGAVLTGIMVHLPPLTANPEPAVDADIALLENLVWVDG